MIVYMRDGEFEWLNTDGDAAGWNGRCFYVAISNTKAWPPEAVHEEAGQGRVHGYLVKKILGVGHQDGCLLTLPPDDVYGGFAVRFGETKYNSLWLNRYGKGNDGDQAL